MRKFATLFYVLLEILTLLSSGVLSGITEDGDNIQVTVENGKLKGKILKSREKRPFYSFTDIPYAKSPKRFELPEPLTEKWDGVRDATTIHSMCAQAFPGVRAGMVFGFQGSEDCLHLDVFVPKIEIKEPLPVMVWIHPGLFVMGMSSMFRPIYFMDEDVIIVSINYRLGALGFLTTGDDVIPSNLGLRDQILALQWVQKNIVNFGGDPKMVTLAGASAGGASSHMLMLSPLAKGLFSKVISQSGTAISPWAVTKHATVTAKKFAEEFSCSIASSKEIADCLKGISAEDLVTAQLERGWGIGFLHRFVPSIETDTGTVPPVLPKWPEKLLEVGEYDKIPIIIGGIERDGLVGSAIILSDEEWTEELNSNWTHIAPNAFYYDHENEDHLSDEKRNAVSTKIRQFYFEDKPVSRDTMDNLTHLFSDCMFIRGIERSASLHAKMGATVFPYMFSYRGAYSFLHLYSITEHNEPTHGDDLLYLFSSNITPDLSKRPEDVVFSKNLIKLWVSFAKTGKPTATWGTAKDWHPLAANEYPVKWYTIDEETEYKEYPYEARIKFWDELTTNELNKE